MTTEQETIAAKDRIIAGTFQCQMQLTQQRSLVMTGHVYSDDTPEQINKRIDMHQDALDRQFTRCDLINKEAQRAAMIAHVEDHLKQLEALAVKQAAANNGGGDKREKISSQERETLKRGQEVVRSTKTNIVALEAMINAARAKLGMPAFTPPA